MSCYYSGPTQNIKLQVQSSLLHITFNIHMQRLSCMSKRIGVREPTLLTFKLSLFITNLDSILGFYRGLRLLDPFGTPRWVFPLLYSFICDHPESCKVTCTYDTNKCQMPCRICLCKKEHLSSTIVNNQVRTEEKMKEVFESMTVSNDNQVTAKEVEDISRKWSVHPIPVSVQYNLTLFEGSYISFYFP